MAATAGFAAAGLSATSAVNSAAATEAQGSYQSAMFQINSKFADLQGDEAIRLGDKEADKVKTNAERVVGSQRAILAAQGLDVDIGSAVDIQEDTRAQAETAAMSIKNNAWREAWGFKQEAITGTYKGKFASMAAGNSANATLLTGGIQAAGYAYQGASAMSRNSDDWDGKW